MSLDAASCTIDLPHISAQFIHLCGLPLDSHEDTSGDETPTPSGHDRIASAYTLGSAARGTRTTRNRGGTRTVLENAETDARFHATIARPT